MTTNRQWLLASRPSGVPTQENFRLVEAPLPAPSDGEVLVRVHYMSLDPYMRGRMDDSKSYAAPQALGAVMQGRTAGEVIASRDASVAVGEWVEAPVGWQQYGVVPAKAVRKLDVSRIPLSAYLGVVGMPGVTAWVGMNAIIDPKPGETVVVSAASGAVGGVVGQLAKLKGCRAVGVAGGAAKCEAVVGEFGFDACVDYKAGRLADDLAEATPNGIDGNFENVGGAVLDAVLARMNAFGRIAVCGLISGYNGQAQPVENFRSLLLNRLKVQGFIVSEHLPLWPKAFEELSALVADGRLKYRETVSQGIESAPQAFIGLLAGRNFGKQLVKLV